MLDLAGLEVMPEEHDLLCHPMTGGVILFARNFASRSQVGELVAQIRSLRPELLLAVDQEGGRVQRFRDGFTRLPPMQALGDLMRQAPLSAASVIADVGWLMAAEILASGVDFSFAPVLDVDRSFCAVIGDRSFSDSPEQVLRCADAFIQGMHEAGMACTGKHFPGHGGVRGDSHEETPHDRRSLEALQGRDLLPFAQLVDKLDAVMPAHIVFSAVDDHCVGFSSVWLQDVLRRQMAFEGVIFSDDLSMRGADVAGGYRQKAEAALAAGCDMVLVCNNRSGALEVLAWLEQSSIRPSSRLPIMKARTRNDWSSLAGSDRRLQAIEHINALRAGKVSC